MRPSPGRERHAAIAGARGMRASPGREAYGHRQGARHADVVKARGMQTSSGREACGHRQRETSVGPRARKDGGQPCMVLLDRVSEGQLNERLMNVVRSDLGIQRQAMT
ncbi:hypothetical protein VNO80_03209 [Phaseolus coccineus]|uniref:Uncharacterized protein n=1 Tax=Phaseolus coccineus TaxID=3886 RepID=A0AAN9RNF0_PHACN